MSKSDWRGNEVSYSKTAGFSSHTLRERPEHDFYATEPKAGELLLEIEEFSGTVWECACGEGHLSEAFKGKGLEVFSSDIVQRGYPCAVLDFLAIDTPPIAGDFHIITNPPYKYADAFILKSIDLLNDGCKAAFLLPIRYLEGKARKKLYDKLPPKTVHVSSRRLTCAINGDFKVLPRGAVCYAWFIWEKGYKGNTVLKWF